MHIAVSFVRRGGRGGGGGGGGGGEGGGRDANPCYCNEISSKEHACHSVKPQQSPVMERSEKWSNFVRYRDQSALDMGKKRIVLIPRDPTCKEHERCTWLTATFANHPSL